MGSCSSAEEDMRQRRKWEKKTTRGEGGRDRRGVMRGDGDIQWKESTRERQVERRRGVLGERERDRPVTKSLP